MISFQSIQREKRHVFANNFRPGIPKFQLTLREASNDGTVGAHTTRDKAFLVMRLGLIHTAIRYATAGDDVTLVEAFLTNHLTMSELQTFEFFENLEPQDFNF